jgi:sugar lactone lactonase YvrE
MITTKRRIFFGWYNIFIAFLIVCNVKSMIIRRPWTSKQWCQNVLAPPWPFAYEKQKDQKIEWKGRTNSNKQDMRHKCTYYGVQSKCHICEDFTCGIQKDQQCAYQLQGVAWSNLAKNIPTVTDAPWSVGGKHRYDYTGGTHICLFLSGGDCLTPFGTNYASCSIRCWGLNSGKIASLYHPEKGKASLLSNGDADASDIWSYPKNFTSDGKPQGMVRSVAGTGEKGFKDGPVASAQFNNPQDVAVDSNGILYIADTNNHRIRKIDPTSKTVSTIAGDGMEGFQDGPALQARFSFPMGIAVYEDPANKVSVYVADTGNHRIRKIMDGKVTCIAGLCGTGVETKILTKSQAQPHPGLADGDLSSSRYDSPMGIAVDQDGIIFVADTGNHLIRRIDMDGKTNTLAGNVVPMDPPIPGCVSPCMKGVAGFRDGNLTYAQFKSPRDIAIGPQKTVVVVDGHRVRRINYDGTTSVLEGVTSSNRVVTLAGSESVPGNVDGSGQESTFHFPSGVSVSADGRVYVTSPITCKIRQVSTSTLVSRPATCFTRLVDIVSPQGCSSYEQEVDEVFTKVSPSLNNIYYNFKQRNEQDPIDGLTLPGRQMKECIGVPPVDTCILG